MKTDSPTPEEIIGAFDLTHCQIAYNGNEIICTPEFIQTMTTRQTNINPEIGSIHAYRLVKAYLRGYSIGLPKQPIFIKNYFRRSYTELVDFNKSQGYCRTDRIWHSYYLNREFEDLLKNPIVDQNLHKNFIVDFEHTSAKERIETVKRLLPADLDVVMYNRHGFMILSQNSGQSSYIEEDDQRSQHLTEDTTYMIINNHIERMSCPNLM
jgi:hypothetical protein